MHASPWFFRSALALLAVTWLAATSAAAGEAPNERDKSSIDRANAAAQAKEKVMVTRGNARAKAIAEAIAAESGRCPGPFLRYSAKLDATLSRFSPAELDQIIEGD